MSTILDALRKAKETSGSNPVDARREILRPQTHDYLASVPDSPNKRSALFKLMLGLAALVIVALTGVVIVLTIKLSRSEVGPARQPAIVEATPVATPSPVPVQAVVQPAPSPAIGHDSGEPMAVSPPPPPIPLEPVATPAPTATPARAAKPTPPPKARTASRSENDGGSALNHVKIDGVFWDEKDPVVLINGEMMRVGSRIGKAKIVRIRRDSSVVFEIDGKQHTVR
jgi:hypothetical protein